MVDTELQSTNWRTAMTAKSTNDPLSAIPQEWQNLNALWEKKKLPQKNFCKIHGVDYSQFIGWRAKIVNAKNKIQKQHRFAEIVATETESTPTQPAYSTDAIRINFPDGISVHIPCELDEKKILLLLSSLRGQA